MINNFEKGCVTYRDGMKMKNDAEHLLHFMETYRTPMTCKEIADKMSHTTYQNIASKMKMLMDCGLVVREIVDGTPTTFEDYDYDYVYADTDYILVDGIKYLRESANPIRYDCIKKQITIIPKISKYSLA